MKKYNFNWNNIFENLIFETIIYNKFEYENDFEYINIFPYNSHSKNIFLTLKSNNITINSVGKDKKLLVYKKKYSLGSIGKNFLTEFKVEIPKFICSLIYNQFGYFNLYLHNTVSLFINNCEQKYFNYLPSNIIYCINLEKRIDRWKNISNYNFNYFKIEKFIAIEGRIGNGWEGCALSHMKLIEYAFDNNLPYIIVAEDDFINITHTNLWEIRLITIINWLIINKDKWEVFNGFPSGNLVGKPINLIDRNVGIIDLNGGYNTHFVIYNSIAYTKILNWYKFYDSTNQYKIHHKFPDLSIYDEFYCHSITIDVWLSNNTNMITCFPLLTNSNNDDSDIIGNFTEKQIKKMSYVKNLIISNKKNKINEMIEMYKSENYSNNIFEKIIKENNEINFIDKFYNNPNEIQTENYFNLKSQIISNFVDTYKITKDTELLFGNNILDNNGDVVIVILSYNSWSHLYVSIDSLIKSNSYNKINKIILYDFDNDIYKKNKIEKYFSFIQYFSILNENKILNHIILNSKNKYYFFIADSWEFLSPFYIEISKLVLLNTNNNICLSIRDIDDTDNKIINEQMCQIMGIFYWKFKDLIEFNYNSIIKEPILIKYELLIQLINLKNNIIIQQIIIPGGFIRYIKCR